MAEEKAKDDDLVLSFLAVRQAVGILGFALPTCLYLYARVFGGGMQPSISEFYHSEMGDVLVGSLCAIGVFLISYKGYAARPDRFGIGDRATSIIAGVFAIGVAVFPVSASPDHALCLVDGVIRTCADTGGGAVPISGIIRHPDWLHFICAAIFFASLAYFCLILFPMGGERREDGSPAMSAEHITYYTCGWTILVAIGALLLPVFADAQMQADLTRLNYTFWWETVAVYAFAVSWLTKGKFLSRPFGLRLSSR